MDQLRKLKNRHFFRQGALFLSIGHHITNLFFPLTNFPPKNENVKMYILVRFPLYLTESILLRLANIVERLFPCFLSNSPLLGWFLSCSLLSQQGGRGPAHKTVMKSIFNI